MVANNMHSLYVKILRRQKSGESIHGVSFKTNASAEEMVGRNKKPCKLIWRNKKLPADFDYWYAVGVENPYSANNECVLGLPDPKVCKKQFTTKEFKNAVLTEANWTPVTISPNTQNLLKKAVANFDNYCVECSHD